MAFSQQQIEEVWNKGAKVDDYDAAKYRKDVAGAWMAKDKYGTETALGWEIDHVYPDSKGGTDNLTNLRPMQWENNRGKGDSYPTYNSVKTADGDKNIDKEQVFTVSETLQQKLKELYKIK
jgi:hypothetical protein